MTTENLYQIQNGILLWINLINLNIFTSVWIQAETSRETFCKAFIISIFLMLYCHLNYPTKPGRLESRSNDTGCLVLYNWQ
jgi:hypothetical protein